MLFTKEMQFVLNYVSCAETFLCILANGNDNKKFKGDRSPCSPSRVLHLRKIPNDVTEAEVISLGLPFGRVTNLLMLKGKSQVCSYFEVSKLQ